MVSEPSEIPIPFIPGDGVGPEIMIAARAVIDAAVDRSSSGRTVIRWEHLDAGEEAFKKHGVWLPDSTLRAIRDRGVALKGPLTTPVGGGIRSLNVAIRQSLDLYSSVRPVRYFEGVPSPMKQPAKMDVVIFRENTEDVYKGIEWKRGSNEAGELIEILQTRFGIGISKDSGIGLKPISERASKRLVRAAIRYALTSGRKSVTLVHKGNIMKFTEGAFRDWGYELARSEFPEQVVTESELGSRKSGPRHLAGIVLNDRIADNMFQQIITRPEEYSVLATPNLNGDYLADACAAQVGGLGVAPGANIGDEAAVFEAVHGTAPKYAGKDVANPCSLMLSGAMMLKHIGLEGASRVLVGAIQETFADGTMTMDLARMGEGISSVGTKQFGEAVLSRIR
ncbi:MAG: NADP-dependent isocitrate dehydrogenase [Thermoplasmata archaeon]|jgi:isocitrate dehydrogenase|nr:NADP-dependent isocitrate dehydrogenase [Thermoplasmata archaeon]